VLAQTAGQLGLVCFGHVQTDEHDARRAARMALDVIAGIERISRDTLAPRGFQAHARAALQLGPVCVGGAGAGVTLLGTTPRESMELQACAVPGQLLVGELARRTLRRWFRFDAGPRGRADCHVLAGELSAATGDGSFAGDDAVPLVGRGEQLERLAKLWSDASDGRSAAVLLFGEPGIGKSRLLREF